VPGLLVAVGRLERHRLLHHLIAGRAWIGLVAFALIGIVTLQLALLELNSNVGRALEREATLQRENAALAIDNSELAAGNRVESLASRLDLQLVPMSALRFLTARPGIFTRRAAAALSAPAKVAVVPAGEAGAASGAGAATAEVSPEAQPAGAVTAGASSEQAGAQSASASQAQPQAGAPEASAQTGAGEAAGAPSAAQGEPASAAGQSGQATPGGGTQAGATG
jgi:hypothetical protein